ncbi:MAG TPA: hypothetical protein VG097_16275, partial [Gemmata sp.]|nr:hypothetical protein [Gemmata sp.]
RQTHTLRRKHSVNPRSGPPLLPLDPGHRYFVSKGGFSKGTPDDLPPSRRGRYDQSGMKPQVLIKELVTA